MHGALTMEEQADGIMANELRAAIYSVEAFLPELRGATVRFMEDNQAVMSSSPCSPVVLRHAAAAPRRSPRRQLPVVVRWYVLVARLVVVQLV